MPIHVPGIRNRRGKAKPAKRNSVVMLSLTAMVDMFTVLTIFLLQNYKETGEVIRLRNDVQLPKATQIRELNPANVVIVSKDMIFLNDNQVIPLSSVKNQQQWLVYPLFQFFKSVVEAEETRFINRTSSRLKEVVAEVQDTDKFDKDFRRVTLQADKTIDFLTIKKLMFTLTEAGASEINFAVVTVENKFKKDAEEEIEDQASL
ncbi:MAG: ExbD/TolR family protein [Bdellovibrionales bacterium]